MMTREQQKARTSHYNTLLPHELNTQEKRYRETAYGIRLQDWLSKMKKENPGLSSDYWRQRPTRIVRDVGTGLLYRVSNRIPHGNLAEARRRHSAFVAYHFREP